MSNEKTVPALFNTAGDIAIQFTSGKNVASLTAEAALFKGGTALAALKDLALDVAFTKANGGRYRAASDIISVAFPSHAKAYGKLFKAEPWTNKAEMTSFLRAIGNAQPGKSGQWNKKQEAALTLIAAMKRLPAFAPEFVSNDVVEGEVVGEAA
jgi:hypothetical protein